MAFTYDTATNAGKVRLLISDTREDFPIFQDDEIAVFLSMEGDDVRLGSALALETIASQQALVLKVIKVLDLSTDGPAVARALMARAAELRKQADEDSGDAFDWAEMVLDENTYAQRVTNEALRSDS